MIKLSNITKSYGTKNVLKNLNYCFNHRDTIYTILGESGAGKTTLLNILYGIDQDYDGEYILSGRIVNSFSSSDWDNIHNKEIGFVFQDYKLLEDMTVFENLDYTYFLKLDEKKSRIDEVLEIINLKEQVNQKVRDLSGGQKQRLAIGRAILNNPSIILLDEPTGNLDDLNTKNVIQYIQKIKKDKIIIIITHDNRLMDYSDVILKLENHSLKVLKEENLMAVSPSFSPKAFSKPKTISYFFHSLKPRAKELIMTNIPVTLIMCIFICIFSIVHLSFNQQIQQLYQGLSNDTIYISSAGFNDNYINELNSKKLTKSDDGTRINFSENDLKNVKKIPHIKSARLYNSSNVSLYDRQELRLNLSLEKKDYPQQVKEVSSYSSAPSIIQFSFMSMNIPYEYAEKFNQINMIYGDYPKDYSDEIVIPDILAMKYFKNAQNALNQKIKFNVYDSDNNTSQKSYTIVGVYKTEYKQHIDEKYGVYVNYIQYDFLDLYLTEEQYKELKNIDINNNRLVKGYHNPIYDTYERYAEAIGTNLGDMIIVVDSPDNVESTQKALDKLFPNLKIISQYEFEHGETAAAFNKIKITIYLGTFGFSLLLGIIIILLNKNYIKTRNKELAILYSMGYSRKHIAQLISVEYLMTLVVDLGLAYFVLKLIQISGFKADDTYKMFTEIFELSQIGQILLFVFIMILLSALFSLYGINKKKLRKYLEGGK